MAHCPRYAAWAECVKIALVIAIVFTSYIRLLSQFVKRTQLTVPLPICSRTDQRPRDSDPHQASRSACRAGDSSSVLLRLHLLDLSLQLLGHGRVAQRRHVAQGPSLGDVAQQPAHDLARARLWQVVGPDDPLGSGELADPLGDGRADALDRLLVAGKISLQGHEGDDRLTAVLVVLPDRRHVVADRD